MSMFLKRRIHFLEGVAGGDDEGCGADGPFQLIEDGGEGIGDGDIIMDELAILVAAALGDTPTHELTRARNDLGFTGGILPISDFSRNAIAKATCINNGEKAIGKFALDLLCELDRDYASRKSLVQQCPQTFANACGIYDNMERTPGLAKGFELAEYSKMVLTGPLLGIDDSVGWELQGLQGG